MEDSHEPGTPSMSSPPPRPLTPEPPSPEVSKLTPPHHAHSAVYSTVTNIMLYFPPQTPPPQVARPPTPLETTLLLLLSNKDLGNTGFVTATELAAALTQLEQGKAVRPLCPLALIHAFPPTSPPPPLSHTQLTPPEIDQLFSHLGLDVTEGGGIPYHQTLPQIVHTINSIREQQTNQLSP